MGLETVHSMLYFALYVKYNTSDTPATICYLNWKFDRTLSNNFKLVSISKVGHININIRLLLVRSTLQNVSGASFLFFLVIEHKIALDVFLLQ